MVASNVLLDMQDMRGIGNDCGCRFGCGAAEPLLLMQVRTIVF